MVAGWLPDEVFGRDSQHIEPFAYLRDLFTRIGPDPHLHVRGRRRRERLDARPVGRRDPGGVHLRPPGGGHRGQGDEPVREDQPPSPDLPLVPGDMPAVGSYGFAGRVRIDELELWVRYRQFCNIVLGL